jgi:hypothetical protein
VFDTTTCAGRNRDFLHADSRAARRGRWSPPVEVRALLTSGDRTTRPLDRSKRAHYKDEKLLVFVEVSLKSDDVRLCLLTPIGEGTS